jgi:hypothetical protein
MDMKSYFENQKGAGMLATADAEGRVNIAVYSRPHVMDDQTVAFIMRDRLSHRNLQSNPQAAYSFIEEGDGCQGVRLYLTKVNEDTDAAKIKRLRRRTQPDSNPNETKFLVTFHIDHVRPAVGDNLADEGATS